MTSLRVIFFFLSWGYLLKSGSCVVIGSGRGFREGGVFPADVSNVAMGLLIGILSLGEWS